VEGLAGGGRGTRESSRRVSMISINSMQLWKCHIETHYFI
jgi:hypothetical protein